MQGTNLHHDMLDLLDRALGGHTEPMPPRGYVEPVEEVKPPEAAPVDEAPAEHVIELADAVPTPSPMDAFAM